MAKTPAFPVHFTGTWVPRANKSNDYLIDRDLQRTKTSPASRMGKVAVTESMGPIYDRTSEHLGSTDMAIIRTRQELLDAVRALQRGIEPYAAQHPRGVYHIRPFGVVLPESSQFDQDPRVLEATAARAPSGPAHKGGAIWRPSSSSMATSFDRGATWAARVEKLADEFDIEIEHHAFDLTPGLPWRVRSCPDQFRRRGGQFEEAGPGRGVRPR